MDIRQPAVYILASQRRGTLYTGVTSNLVKRVWEHKHDMVAAITREKRIKAGPRARKLALIE